MSLLVTSCTMGQQPDRLLDKGPQYLRTRTNRGLFAHHRKSAAELLAESKAQFYKVPSASAHERHELVTSPDGDHHLGSKPQEQLPRSKSEFDISTLKTLIAFESIDDGTNEPSAQVQPAVVGVSSVAGQDLSPRNRRRASEDLPAKLHGGRPKINIRKASTGETESIAFSPTSLKFNSPFQEKSMLKSDGGQKSPIVTTKSSADTTTTNKEPLVFGHPVRLPRNRKYQDKPVPPPRKFKPKTPPRQIQANQKSDEKSESSPDVSALNVDSIDGKRFVHSKEAGVKSNLATPKRKRSLVETLAQQFTSLCTDFQFSSSPSSNPQAQDVALSPTKYGIEDSKKECSTPTLYQAKPIYIPQEVNSSKCQFQAKPVFISPPLTSQGARPATNKVQDREDSKLCQNSSDTNNNVKGRKRYPEVPMSNKYSNTKRERKASDLEPITFISDPVKTSDANSTSEYIKGTVLEMSIESVEPVVYHTEVKAIPSAITTSVDSLEGGNDEPREVTRVNSSLSGKMDSQDTSPHHGHSPTHPTSSVPRSHSDISCRLEGQHSRDSSLVSNHSRLSRASAGADLEKFFNQMGLERGVLEPFSRLKELQSSEVLASVSSLDSHDASSIGSTFSGSENDCSESQSVERSQQPTSVVERNARIIKWLCNVRKAKSQSLNVDGNSASSSAASSAAGNA